jgi:hypothetical protein
MIAGVAPLEGYGEKSLGHEGLGGVFRERDLVVMAQGTRSHGVGMWRSGEKTSTHRFEVDQQRV